MQKPHIFFSMKKPQGGLSLSLSLPLSLSHSLSLSLYTHMVPSCMPTSHIGYPSIIHVSCPLTHFLTHSLPSKIAHLPLSHPLTRSPSFSLSLSFSHMVQQKARGEFFWKGSDDPVQEISRGPGTVELEFLGLLSFVSGRKKKERLPFLFNGSGRARGGFLFSLTVQEERELCMTYLPQERRLGPIMADMWWS